MDSASAPNDAFLGHDQIYGNVVRGDGNVIDNLKIKGERCFHSFKSSEQRVEVSFAASEPVPPIVESQPRHNREVSLGCRRLGIAWFENSVITQAEIAVEIFDGH